MFTPSSMRELKSYELIYHAYSNYVCTDDVKKIKEIKVNFFLTRLYIKPCSKVHTKV